MLIEQVINWQPPCSPYLNLCDFYLWGTLKDKEYVNYLHTAEWEENIQQVILNIFQVVLHCVFWNLPISCETCLQPGHHFEHLLVKSRKNKQHNIKQQWEILIVCCYRKYKGSQFPSYRDGFSEGNFTRVKIPALHTSSLHYDTTAY